MEKIFFEGTPSGRNLILNDALSARLLPLPMEKFSSRARRAVVILNKALSARRLTAELQWKKFPSRARRAVVTLNEALSARLLNAGLLLEKIFFEGGRVGEKNFFLQSQGAFFEGREGGIKKAPQGNKSIPFKGTLFEIDLIFGYRTVDILIAGDLFIFVCVFQRSDSNEVGDEMLQLALGRSVHQNDRSGVSRQSENFFAKDD